MSDATGLGWVRTVQPLTVRAGRSKRDEPLGTIPPDQDVYVAAVSGKRGQITSPYVGWISIRTAGDEATIVQEPLLESEKQRDAPVTTGWVRALRDLNVRKGREKRTELVGSIALGTRVFIEELQGMRAHIRKPLEGWISVITAEREPTVSQETSAAPEVSAPRASQPSDSSDSSDTDTSGSSDSNSNDSQTSPSSDATSSKPTLKPPVAATQGESRQAPEAAKSQPPAQAAESSSRGQGSSASSSASSGAGSRTDSNSSRRAIDSKRLLQPVAQAVEVPRNGDVSSQGQDGQDDLLPGIGWWWTHLKAIVCKDEKDRRAFIREPLEGWIQVQSPSGKPILAAQAPAQYAEGEKQALLEELLEDVEPVSVKAPVDEPNSQSPAVKREIRVEDEPARKDPEALVARRPASESPAVSRPVHVVDEHAAKTPAVKREVRVADEPDPQNPAVKHDIPVADGSVQLASKTPAAKQEVRVAEGPDPHTPAVKRDIPVADEPTTKNAAVAQAVQVADEPASKTPAVKREVRIADGPDPPNPAVKQEISLVDEPASKNPTVKLHVASENHMSPDTGKADEQLRFLYQQQNGGTGTSSKSSQSSDLQAEAAEMPVTQPGPAPSLPEAPLPAATSSSSGNPRPDSAEQEGTVEEFRAGDETKVRIASSNLAVAGPIQVPDEIEPQKSEEMGSRGAAEHKVEMTSMASSTKAMAKATSLCAAHPDVSEPSVPCSGKQISPDLQPASVVISSEVSRTKDADEQASPASPESAGIQPQPSALSAEGLSSTTRRPSIPVLVHGMDTLTAPAQKIGVLDWAVAEPLHQHYETAQAIKLPPRSEWWVHEKEASERRLEALEARLRSAQAAQDPVIEWNLHRLEDTLDSPCGESRASPTGIPLPQMEQAFHEEEGLEAAATALLRSAADEEWSRPRGAGTSGHMYPTTDDDWAAPLFSPSSRRNESRTAQSSLLDPAAEAPSAGPIPSWIYRGVGAVPLPPRPVSATEEPPPEYEASSVSVSEAPDISRVPSSRGSLRLQKDRELLQRRGDECRGGTLPLRAAKSYILAILPSTARMLHSDLAGLPATLDVSVWLHAVPRPSSSSSSRASGPLGRLLRPVCRKCGTVTVGDLCRTCAGPEAFDGLRTRYREARTVAEDLCRKCASCAGEHLWRSCAAAEYCATLTRRTAAEAEAEKLRRQLAELCLDQRLEEQVKDPTTTESSHSLLSDLNTVFAVDSDSEPETAKEARTPPFHGTSRTSSSSAAHPPERSSFGEDVTFTVSSDEEAAPAGQAEVAVPVKVEEAPITPAPDALDRTGAEAKPVPLCPGHGERCREVEVRKEGPNKGRHFFACPRPREQQCDFFAWADAGPAGQAEVAVPVKVEEAPIRPESDALDRTGAEAKPVPLCPGHGEPCREVEVKKEGPNKGRHFFACARPREQQCDFFAWADRPLPERRKHPRDEAGREDAPGASEPVTPRRKTKGRASAGAHSTPAKRRRTSYHGAEGRLERFLPTPSKRVRERIDRAKEHRLLLVNFEVAARGEITATVLGHTGNVYDVRIGARVVCTCPDFLKAKAACKHLLFVFLRVLRIPDDDPRLWQRALIPRELSDLRSRLTSGSQLPVEVRPLLPSFLLAAVRAL
ncbi:NEIL3 [Symbiodinium sp. CCMP2592]|nr:NEIL3 [Symbiodinium sp. CCMP2592]